MPDLCGHSLLVPAAQWPYAHWQGRKGAEQVRQCVPYKYRPGLQVVAYNRGYTARVGWSWVVSSVCVMIPVLQCRVDVMMGHAYVEFLVMPGLC